MSDQPTKKFTDRLIEFAEVVPIYIARGVNTAFKAVLGGTAVERIIRDMQPTVQVINSLEPEVMKLKDTELSAKTIEFKNRLADGETLDDLLPEAFAVVREAARRLEGTPYPKRHFDVQLIGGMVLHQGKIAEMVTGEGKTLVATLPAYLNALEGKGVHVITVNDYLARRDAAWMSPVYEFLGMTVGAIQSDMESEQRQPIYAGDIVYGTNNEFGFDYLRDNMKIYVEHQVQRKLHYAIIDEVDSALIDEARTPLIISGMPEGSSERYYIANRAAQRLQKGPHYEVKEKERTVVLTEEGILAAQKIVGVTSFYTGANVEWPHFIDNALKAKELYRLDREYVVREGEVLIVDEFTGRLMAGRRWSDGLHQAVEAKENLRVREENQTLATITFQNFFRLYDKLSGMTGTALTEAAEFGKIYNLEVVPIPPNKSLHRVSYPDLIFGTDREKVDAIIEEIAQTHATERPVLVGTVSVERSEMLSERLKRRGIKHVVLNAKYHKKESAIVAQAGEPAAVTIATNMAGRGTDIVLGGNPTLELQAELETRWQRDETQAKDLINVFRYAQRFMENKPQGPTQIVLPGLRPGEQAVWDPELSAGENIHRIAAAISIEITPEDSETILKFLNDREARADADHEKVIGLGGLHIIGTERHEARRIDNQLRGRAGRQGDPGSSRFFLSLEDDLMRIFMGDWVRNFMQKIGLGEGQPIESGIVSRRIESAQKKVEEQNFTIRKHLLEYDEVMDEQRKLVYGERQAVLEAFRDRPPVDVAEEILAEYVEADDEGDGTGRLFSAIRKAVKDAAGVDVNEEDWRRLLFREFCEHAARLASTERPADDEIADAATGAVDAALGELEDPARWSAEQQRERVNPSGFAIEKPWAERFAEHLAEHLAGKIHAATAKAMIEGWVRRGLDADLPLLGEAKWDFDTFTKWIADLPCEINGNEWSPLLNRVEKIEPLVAERLIRGLGNERVEGVARKLADSSVRLYLQSQIFLLRPTAERICVWADYRLGVLMEPDEILAVAAEASASVARETAAAKAKQLGQPDGVALYWHFPAVFSAVRSALTAKDRDFIGLSNCLRDDLLAETDPFELSKLNDDDLTAAVAKAIEESRAPKIYCRGLDDIVNRTFLNVISSTTAENLQTEDSPEERSFQPLVSLTRELDLSITRNQWLNLSREELSVVLGSQARNRPEDAALDFAKQCIQTSVSHFLGSEDFAQDASYSHLASWAHSRFSFGAAPLKLETTLARKVDARRNEAKQMLLEDVQKLIEAEGAEPPEMIKRLVGSALQAYFMINAATEALDVEATARWINSKLHVSVPAADMQEMMDIDDRTVSNLAIERAQRQLAKQRPERIIGDAINAAFDCFLPPETFPDNWKTAELEEWLKKSEFESRLDVYALTESVRTDILGVFIEATLAGYGERPGQVVAVDTVRQAVNIFLDSDLAASGRNFATLSRKLNQKFNLGLDAFELSKLSAEKIRELAEREAFAALDRRGRQIGRLNLHWIERVLILQAIDTRWKDHLAAMDSLKGAIGMRGYAQVDPKLEYKRDGYEAFESMIASIQEEVSNMLLRVEINLGTEVNTENRGTTVHGETSAYQQQQEAAVAGSQKSEGPRPVRAAKEPNRNDLCPCGSGKKYKNCCMGK